MLQLSDSKIIFYKVLTTFTLHFYIACVENNLKFTHTNTIGYASLHKEIALQNSLRYNYAVMFSEFQSENYYRLSIAFYTKILRQEQIFSSDRLKFGGGTVPSPCVLPPRRHCAEATVCSQL